MRLLVLAFCFTVFFTTNTFANKVNEIRVEKTAREKFKEGFLCAFGALTAYSVYIRIPDLEISKGLQQKEGFAKAFAAISLVFMYAFFDSMAENKSVNQ